MFCFFPKGRVLSDLADYLSSGEVVALCLAAPDGINRWKRVLGPTKPSEARVHAPQSIRAIYGDPDNDFHNAAHGKLTLRQLCTACNVFVITNSLKIYQFDGTTLRHSLYRERLSGLG